MHCPVKFIQWKKILFVRLKASEQSRCLLTAKATITTAAAEATTTTSVTSSVTSSISKCN